MRSTTALPGWLAVRDVIAPRVLQYYSGRFSPKGLGGCSVCPTPSPRPSPRWPRGAARPPPRRAGETVHARLRPLGAKPAELFGLATELPLGRRLKPTPNSNLQICSASHVDRQ